MRVPDQRGGRGAAWAAAGLVVAGGLAGALTWFAEDAEAAPGVRVLDGPDRARAALDVVLRPVADELARPVDIQVPPGEREAVAVVLQAGRLVRLELATGARVDVPVPLPALETRGGEQGLLGLAFHPRFAENGRFFLNATERDGRGGVETRVTGWRQTPGARFGDAAPRRERVLLAVTQPYSNHNGGGLAFGPDGGLYVGLGDGGSAGDPQGHGQNPRSLLGKMLRLDVDAPGEGPAPARVYATGLRNPWRYAFEPGPAGRLVVADVGQDRFEEVDLVAEGANLGWNLREGRDCFPPGRACPAAGFVEPIHVYGRDEGVSITGGYVYSGAGLSGLRGRFLFGDYGSGRLWALSLPERAGSPAQPPTALGRFGFAIACIAPDPAGEPLLCDHTDGRIWRVTAP